MLSKEIGTFLIIGIINTIVGLTSVFILYDLFINNYWISTFIGNSIGMLVSYLLNKKFTFKNEGSVSSSLFKFLIVVLLCYYGSYWIGLHLSVTLAKIYPYLLQFRSEISILFGAGLYTVSNYIGQKFLVFNKTQFVNEKSI